MPTKHASDYRYLYGTEAPSYTNYPQQTPAYEPTPSAAPAKKTKSKVDWVFGFRLSLCGILLFASTFSFVYTYSILSSKQRELKNLKIELREAKSDISSTEAIIAEALNLDYIRQRAQSELKMSEPLPHQVVYIDFPKESYTTYGE
ncbi:MAG: hypothetical protein AB9856_03325 [Cellulosilyticaceae bacterium]